VADWRQIQGRIRKAKAGADAPAKLTQLYEKTRDAMVAYELAEVLEKSGQADMAAAWYTTAAQRFRRVEWKQKAEAALVRLGAPLPTPTEVAAAAEASAPAVVEPPAAYAAGGGGPAPPETSREASVAPPALAERSPAPEEQARLGVPSRRRRRRGRRGGRGRRRGARETSASPAPASAAAPQTDLPPAEPSTGELAPPERFEPTRLADRQAGASWQSAPRAGEPALASRMAQLESQLRRLISSPQHSLAEAEQAPAGPGVFLLSDLDQVTSYYVEACQTLRVALGNLLRGRSPGMPGRGRRRDASDSLKTSLAKHLGISESQATKYLKQDCAVRWIQLDEGASPLAHFAIAVLRPPLND